MDHNQPPRTGEWRAQSGADDRRSDMRRRDQDTAAAPWPAAAGPRQGDGGEWVREAITRTYR